MGLFKGALAKEGKGVEKNASEGKSALWLFLEIYGRKFWNVCQVGIIYLITALPTLAVVWLCSGLISTHVGNMVNAVLKQILTDPGMVQSYVAVFDIIVRIFIALLFMAFWGMGPVTAGFTYIMRNYSREEHAWPWADFREHTKNNFRQALVVWIIDVIVFVLLITAFMFYSTEAGAANMLKYVIAFVFLMYTMMHFYIYQLMVTFKLTIREIFRNAALLAIGALPANGLVLVLVGFIHIVFPYLGLKFFAGAMGYWTSYFVVALLMLQGLTGLIINFVANRTIKKYMLDKMEVKDINGK